MIKTLFKKQMLELNQGFFTNRKTGKARSKVSSAIYIVLFAVLIVGCFGGMFLYLSNALSGLIDIGLGWMYFTLMGFMALFLGVFGSVFNTFSSVYQAKDNDLLLSLPVPVSYILLVRLLGVYLLGLMYSGIVIIPAFFVYYRMVPFRAAGLAGAVLYVFLLSVIVLILSCILGWVVAKINKKLKNKSFITVIVSVAFFAGYYYVYFRASSMLQNLLANAQMLSAGIKGSAYPLYVLGRAGEGDGVSLLILAAVVLVLFAVVWIVLSRSFIQIATGSGAVAKVRYKEKRAKKKSVDGALFGRELGKFLSSSTYMLNCALGTLMLLIVAVLALVKGGQVRDMLLMAFEGNLHFLAVLCSLAICFLVAMNDITAPSISLEGKNIWLAQSLPVSTWQILRAKLNLHLVMTEIPAFLCGVCVAVVLRADAVMSILMIALPLVIGVFFAALGLALNLKAPNLKWTSENVAVKQSFVVVAAMFGGWLYVILLGAAYFMLFEDADAIAYMAVAVAVTILVSGMLLLWLKRRGVRKYESLQ